MMTFIYSQKEISGWQKAETRVDCPLETKAFFQCCFSWFSEGNVVYFSWNIKRLIEKMMFSPFLTSPIVWPQWWSFADVSQQGLRFRKKISKKNFFDLIFTEVHMCHQKVPKSDFQSHFSMSKIIQIFLIFFFIEEYQFRRRFFVNVIFWKLQFLNHFVF